MMDKKNFSLQRLTSSKKKYDKLSVKEKYDLEMNALKTLYDQKYISEAQYQKWKAALKRISLKISRLNGSLSQGAVPENDGTKAQEIRYNFNQQKSKLDDALKNGTIDADEYATRLSRIKADMNAALVDLSGRHNQNGCRCSRLLIRLGLISLRLSRIRRETRSTP